MLGIMILYGCEQYSAQFLRQNLDMTYKVHFIAPVTFQVVARVVIFIVAGLVITTTTLVLVVHGIGALAAGR